MIGKYGQPQGAMADMLVWNNSGAWKRTIVYRDTVAHSFPTPHPDLLEQFIDCKCLWINMMIWLLKTAVL